MKKTITSQAVVETTATRIGLLRLLPAIAVVIIAITCATADEVKLKSPNSKVAITIKPGAHLTYSVTFRGERVVEPSQMGIIVDGKDLGQNTTVIGKPVRSVLNETYPTRGVHTQAVNHCSIALIPVEGGPAKTPWQLEVRAYNDGVAYRYIVPGEGIRHINAESTEWSIPIGTVLWRQNEENRSYEAR